MKQQITCFFAALCIAVFLTFSLVEHTHNRDAIVSSEPFTELYSPSVANKHNHFQAFILHNAHSEPYALCAEPQSISQNSPQRQADNLWFASLERALESLTKQYQQSIKICLALQIFVQQNISELSRLFTAITSAHKREAKAPLLAI